MNVRKLLSRLNAATVRYDTGRGGIPEMTPQDVAALLSRVTNHLARDVLCLAWWPDGAALSRGAIADAIRAEVMTEFSRRHKAAQIARLDLHLIECEIAARRSRKREDEQSRSRAQSAVDATRASLWPSASMHMYPAIVAAALRELCSPRLCKACHGRGDAITSAGPRRCDSCDGVGVREWSHVSRAEALSVNVDTYRSTWRPVYEWTLALVEGLEQTAALQLSRVLREERGEFSLDDACCAAAEKT